MCNVDEIDRVMVELGFRLGAFDKKGGARIYIHHEMKKATAVVSVNGRDITAESLWDGREVFSCAFEEFPERFREWIRDRGCGAQ